jgi:hypothetical protein
VLEDVPSMWLNAVQRLPEAIVRIPGFDSREGFANGGVMRKIIEHGDVVHNPRISRRRLTF